jgi:DnaK suppressor protein
MALIYFNLMKNKKKMIYEPSDSEEFMNPRQTEYFKNLLLDWKRDLLKESSNTLSHLKEETSNKPDDADRATIESERSLELRTRDRERKLLNKIDKALRKIEEGTYGYCEETNQPISIARLKARPIATLSLEAQEMHEKFEKIYKEKEY